MSPEHISAKWLFMWYLYILHCTNQGVSMWKPNASVFFRPYCIRYQHIAAFHAVGFGLHLLHLEADSYFGALMDGVCVTNSAVLVIY